VSSLCYSKKRCEREGEDVGVFEASRKEVRWFFCVMGVEENGLTCSSDTPFPPSRPRDDRTSERIWLTWPNLFRRTALGFHYIKLSQDVYHLISYSRKKTERLHPTCGNNGNYLSLAISSSY
jgi:hypothetical protein